MSEKCEAKHHLQPLSSCLELTGAVPLVSGPEQSTGLLIFPLSVSVVVPVIRKSVYTLVAAGVTVCVVYDHVF